MVIEARLSALLNEGAPDAEAAAVVVVTTYPPSWGDPPAAGAPAGSDRIIPQQERRKFQVCSLLCGCSYAHKAGRPFDRKFELRV